MGPHPLVRWGTPEYRLHFGKGPPGIVDGRPETDWAFATWLLPRFRILSEAVEVDAQRRPLAGADAVTARRVFKSPEFRARVGVIAETLRRGLYLHRWANKHSHVAAGEMSLPDLLRGALKMILDSQSVEDDFLDAQGLSKDELVARGWSGKSWLEVIILRAFGDDARVCADKLPELQEYFMGIGGAIAGHMQAVFENVLRTSWLSAGMLSADPVAAQRNGRRLRDHLIGTPRRSMTTFEKAFSTDVRMADLNHFCNRAAPVVLWRGEGGRYVALYRWLAVRFLGNEDSVLLCEGVHAMWQWIEVFARAIKLKQMNAQLQVRSWINAHEELPSWEDLRPHLEAVTASHRRRYDAVRAGGEVAVGG